MQKTRIWEYEYNEYNNTIASVLCNFAWMISNSTPSIIKFCAQMIMKKLGKLHWAFFAKSGQIITCIMYIYKLQS